MELLFSLINSWDYIYSMLQKTKGKLRNKYHPDDAFVSDLRGNNSKVNGRESI